MVKAEYSACIPVPTEVGTDLCTYRQVLPLVPITYSSLLAVHQGP